MRNVFAAVRSMSKLQGQIWGGWMLSGGSLATLAAMFIPMPDVLRTTLTGTGVGVMLVAIGMVVWSMLGVPDATTPGSRAITPNRAVEPATPGPRRASTAGRPTLPGHTAAAPRRAAV